MVRIFDLPPDGLKDGAVAVEVDENGNPVNKNNQYDLNLIPETDFSTPTEENPAGSNPSGLKISIRPKLAVNVMRAEFPLEIIDEINQHIDDVLVPAKVDDPVFGSVGKDHSSGLVGQIRQNERSAQTTFPHENDEVGEQFSSVLLTLATEYMKHTVGDLKCDAEIQSMWTIHSYEGDYNPVHDHGTKTPIGLSCILYLKVPPQIEALGNPSEVFEGLNGSVKRQKVRDYLAKADELGVMEDDDRKIYVYLEMATGNEAEPSEEVSELAKRAVSMQKPLVELLDSSIEQGNQ